MVTAKQSRDDSFDNIRFFLMLFVVFAHFLEEAVPFPGSDLLYSVIYSFHMPAFLFLFGYFAKFDFKRILRFWVIPYFIFQTLYLLFCTYVLQADSSLHYIRPYWILWYLLACTYYQLLIPVYDIPKKWGQAALWLCSLGVCLLVGYVDFIGYPLSLSRFFVFQPWFLLGYYCRKNQLLEKLAAWPPKKKWITNSLLIVGTVLAVCFQHIQKLPNGLLYGSYAYSKIHSNAGMRFVTVIIAFLFIALIFLVIRPLLAKRIFLITKIGQHTLPIFLLHGFVQKAIAAFCPQLLSTPWKLLLLTCAVMVVFGNRFTQSFLDILCLRKPRV